MVLHKNRAILFGGVFDEDLDNDNTQSIFYNEL